MKFIYVHVHDPKIEASKRLMVGSFDYTTVRVIIKNLRQEKQFFFSNSHYIYIQKSSGVSFVAVSLEQDLKLGFGFLAQVESLYKNDCDVALEWIRRNMEFEENKLDFIMQEIEVIRGQMVTNIDLLLQRGEKLEQIVQKSDALVGLSFSLKPKPKEIEPFTKRVKVQEHTRYNKRTDDRIYYSLTGFCCFVFFASILRIFLY